VETITLSRCLLLQPAPLRQRRRLCRQLCAMRLEGGRLPARMRASLSRGRLRARGRSRQVQRARARLRAPAALCYICNSLAGLACGGQWRLRLRHFAPPRTTTTPQTRACGLQDHATGPQRITAPGACWRAGLRAQCRRACSSCVPSSVLAAAARASRSSAPPCAARQLRSSAGAPLRPERPTGAAAAARAASCAAARSAARTWGHSALRHSPRYCCRRHCACTPWRSDAGLGCFSARTVGVADMP